MIRKEQDRFENEILRLPGNRNRLDNKIESLRTEELVSFWYFVFIAVDRDFIFYFVYYFLFQKLISVEATELKHQLDPPPPPPPPLPPLPGEPVPEPVAPIADEEEEVEVDREAIIGELDGYIQRLQDLAIEVCFLGFIGHFYN